MINTEIRSVENNFGNPKLSPPDIMVRVLKLIDHAQTREDLSEDSVQNALGLYMHSDSRGGIRDMVVSQMIDPDWGWGINNYSLEGRRVFRFEFLHSGRITEMTPVCQMDLNNFQDSLFQMGYQHISSVRAGLLGRQYKRGDAHVRISFVGEKNELVMHDCIKTVMIEI